MIHLHPSIWDLDGRPALEAVGLLSAGGASYMPAENPVNTVDVRETPVWERHPRIFETFDNLNPGEAMLLINDHDPKPLYYQMSAERPGTFEWKYKEEGPRVWSVEITRLS